ncbi:hypothetical protein GIB67_010918 [Kingdonia uniflora]|uniref:Pentatricopeptide repeat-containing protein n=1 Tax=Kingdonia uniflora TaxID=39325 RepID=A0A7J7M4Z5_9MAGN|nr:hypothetical protein GIB67_010918 [Kingdonia uniflora]
MASIDRTRKRTSQFDDPNSPPKKRPSFTSYLQTPNLSPKIKLLCEILANVPSPTVEKSLEETGVRVTAEDVEQVLKLSYSFPGPTVKFFRWAGHQLNDNHSPYAWNLVVDLLGKNSLFEAMWDAIKSMKNEGLLSLATFASVFSSYVVSDRVDEAIMTFEVMDQYGCARDVVGLNSLLSAICREGKTCRAKEFLDIAKSKIRPDRDTYAIVLEGWENEGNGVEAEKTFGEMVNYCGWDPLNVPAYDAFLNTLLKGRDGIHDAMKFFDVMKEKRCYPGLKFFKSALDEIVKAKNSRVACSLWDSMVRNNMCRPDTQMYNSIISLQCSLHRDDVARELFDEMVFNGAFPDSHTYNVLIQVMLKIRKLSEVSALFSEMVKNECIPDFSNCVTAITVYLDVGDSSMAIKVWKCLVANEPPLDGLETTGNKLVNGLRDLNMLPEARKYAEDMIDMGVKLNSSTLSKLKHDLSKLGKSAVYDDLLKKWKSNSSSH